MGTTDDSVLNEPFYGSENMVTLDISHSIRRLVMKEIIDVMIPENTIQKRIEEIAEEISRDYAGLTVTLICVLKGGVIFFSDLARKLNVDIEMDFIVVSSYENAPETSGTVKIVKDIAQPVTGKHVLLVEDILDTGHTLSQLMRHLSEQQPASLKICTLLDKPDRRVVACVIPEYTGFVIPDQFVIGYGLDYKQRYRQLPYIGLIRFEK